MEIVNLKRRAGMIKAIIVLLIGFLLLVKGADWFVEGASSIAKKIKIPSFVIGLTIVAFGTSAPELAVSVTAALKGSNDIAIGNVVGSNIFNTLVVLGMSAAIMPIIVEKGMIKRDYPMSIFVSLLLGVLAMDTILWKKPGMQIGRGDGIILLLVFAVYMFMTVKAGIQNRIEDEPIEELSLWKSILIAVLGLAGIVLGGDWSVDGAKEIARILGMSEALIGLTIVAIGTSLPELVTSIVAARKGENDIAVGNVIGSNIFNILLILGVSSVIHPMDVSQTYLYDIGMLILTMLAVYLPIAKTKKVGRGTGIVMVLCYVVYTGYLILR